MPIKSIPNSIIFNYSYEVILNDLSLEHVPTKNKGRPRPTGKAKTRKVSAIPGKQQSSLIISVTTNKRHYLDRLLFSHWFYAVKLLQCTKDLIKCDRIIAAPIDTTIGHYKVQIA